MSGGDLDAGGRGVVGLARGVPTWVLCPALLDGVVWLKIGEGVRVLGVNREKTAAIDVHVDCEWVGSVSVSMDAGAVAPFFKPLKSIGSVMDVKVGESLTLALPFDRKLIEISLPADLGEIPSMRLPEPKFECSAYGVFDETVRLLKRVSGSSSVRVRVRVEKERLIVEPPRKIVLLRRERDAGGENAGGGFEPIEVRVHFGDLHKVLDAFKAADLNPSVLWLSDRILGLKAEHGRARVEGLIAGQID
ncbi:MAG: hypothetical protein QXF46_03355 [Thermofilaceae archaeon]